MIAYVTVKKATIVNIIFKYKGSFFIELIYFFLNGNVDLSPEAPAVNPTPFN